MSKTIGSEGISRRKALSLLGLAAMFGLAASSTVLTISDAEAQTIGMDGVRRGVPTGVEGVTTGVEDVWYDVSYGMKDAGHDVTYGGVITER